MCKFYLITFFIIGANCVCLSPTIYKDVKAHVENITLAKTTCVYVNENTQTDLDELQEKLMQRAELMLDQKFAVFSAELQTFGDRLHSIHKGQQIVLDLKDCKGTDVFQLGEKFTPKFFLSKYQKEVICDNKKDGGEWLIIQQRKEVDNQVSFNRNWTEYKNGFGDLDTEFWIGNEFLHQITNDKSYELRIDMKHFSRGYYWVKYGEFKVKAESWGYRLVVGDYHGNAADRLQFSNNQRFSTYDRDNDHSANNCARELDGGFWFDICNGFGNDHLNGVYPKGITVAFKTMQWGEFGSELYLKEVQMKIRQKR